MKISLFASKALTFCFLALFSTACMRMQSSGTANKAIPEEDEEIEVYISQPENKTYQEAMRYAIVGSNLITFERLLNRVKDQARKDGCEALVQVKFYKQQYSKIGSSFPAIEAVGVRFVSN